MGDVINQLEAELAGMQPTPMPNELAHRIELEFKSANARVSPWPDRFLLSAIASGALAACLLLAVMTVTFAEPDHPAAPGSIVVLAPSLHAPATPLAFAHGSPEWADVLK